jgi:hypothetical protein
MMAVILNSLLVTAKVLLAFGCVVVLVTGGVVRLTNRGEG